MPKHKSPPLLRGSTLHALLNTLRDEGGQTRAELAPLAENQRNMRETISRAVSAGLVRRLIVLTPAGQELLRTMDAWEYDPSMRGYKAKRARQG